MNVNSLLSINYFRPRLTSLCGVWVLFFLFVIGIDTGAVAAENVSGPKSPLAPAEAMKLFRLPPGLKIELVASEPDVVDPVAIRFDEANRMWVVEMRDYPHGPGENEKPKSRIRILEDRDGDGRFETANTFAENLLFVTGLQPWRGGVIVTLAGRVAYMKDTNGDGRADIDETWYTGFAEKNTQLRANHPRFGYDNHIYVANGLRGGAVRDARRSDSPVVSISGLDFRFHPTTGAYNAISGNGQFGLTFDEFGNRYVCTNRNPLKQIVLEDKYIRRNPRVRIPTVLHDVAAAGAESRVFPISRAWTTSNLHAGQFTAACGVKIYLGDALGKSYYGNSFTCDPTGNFVHREIIAPAGATFAAHPARKGVEFLASTDEWFRPVNLQVGPDGALYVVDMHRAVIEHPQFMPNELKERPDLLLGTDRGRIYRIVREDAPAPQKTLPLAARSALARFVVALESPNEWTRETARRLLYEKQDKSIAPQLVVMAKSGNTAAARIAALWLLDGLDSLEATTVAASLADPHPAVRRHALQLAETRWEDSAELRKAASRLAQDENPQVRFQLALSLTAFDAPRKTALLEQILLADAGDVWTRRAVALAAGDAAADLAISLLKGGAKTGPGAEASFADAVREFCELAGATGNADQQVGLLSAIADLSNNTAHVSLQQVALQAFLSKSGGQPAALKRLFEKSASKQMQQKIENVFQQAEQTAANASVETSVRIQALNLLPLSPLAGDVLRRLALKEADNSVRNAAIRGVSRQSDLETWRQLLGGFAGESPMVRGAILDGALARTARTKLLLDAVENGGLKMAEIDATRLNRLLRSRDAGIQQRAKKLAADSAPADRKKALADYQGCLELSSNPALGREIFRKNCATCHRVGEIGVNVAPDISDSRTKTALQILTDVLQPNRAIDANYISYSAVTNDGRILTGVLTSETATSITIKQPENKTVTLLRDEIEELRSNGISLMPDGLEKNIPLQDMAHLIAYIKQWRYLDGRTPLGGPAK